MKKLIFLSFTVCTIISCQQSGEISATQAENLVENYLELNPLYETGDFNTTQMRLTTDKDNELITAIQQLENEGLVEINEARARKKWFSKDSVMIITPNLTVAATPYVVKQGKNKTEVKTVVYQLDEKQDVTFENKSKTVATFNAVLLKDKTPFYAFGRDKNPNSEFITRKFKAKYSEEYGWELVD